LAGLKQNDVLLLLADKPLGAVTDLTKHLRTATDAPVALKLIRAGKPVTIQVRPVYRVTLGPATEQKTEYYIGVSIEAADEALRAQLALPKGQGVVVNDVVSGSPAEKAGVKKYDILLDLGGKHIDSPESLTRQVQSAQDKPTTLKLLRAGKALVLPVTGTVRKVEVSAYDDAIRVWMLAPTRRGYGSRFGEALQSPGAFHRIGLAAPASGDDLRQRLDRVENELKAIRAALDQVNESLKTKIRD
jgi:C-terminal processing protease CtpA/Prc